MLIKQISVFVENRQGRLAKIASLLGENGIDIRALSVADTTDFGILRLIVSQPEKANELLRENGFTVSITNVIAVGIKDIPGGLSTALTIMDENGIGIEYMYAFISRTQENATVILRVEDSERAISALTQNGIEILKSSEIF